MRITISAQDSLKDLQEASRILQQWIDAKSGSPSPSPEPAPQMFGMFGQEEPKVQTSTLDEPELQKPDDDPKVELY